MKPMYWIVGVLLCLSALAADTLYALPYVLPKGLWISNVGSDVYYSRTHMDKAIKAAEQLGVDSLFPVIWNKQSFFYRSEVIARHVGSQYVKTTVNGEDILRNMVSLATKHGYKIYPSFESGLKLVMGSEGYTEAGGLGKYFMERNWLNIHKNGEIYEECYFEVCFASINIVNPEVRDFLFSLVEEVITGYDIDGLLFDDHFSLPRYALGCDPTVEQFGSLQKLYADFVIFAESLWLKSIKDLLNRPCDEFSKMYRSQVIIDFFKDVKDLAAKHGKKILLSPAGLPRWSRDEWHLDWKQMVKQEIVDGVIMQAFRDKSFGAMINDKEVLNLAKNYPDVPIGVVILLGLKKYHHYAYGKRVYKQTYEALSSGRVPSYYYHDTVDLPVEGNTLEYRRLWIEKTRDLLNSAHLFDSHSLWP